MLKFFTPGILRNEVGNKVLTLGIILFFVFLSDAILSFWVPNFVQDVFKSSLTMGLVLSFSSIIGFGSDLIIPQVIRGVTVKKLILLGILTSLSFSLLLMGSNLAPYILLILMSMAVWGIYYELLGFGEQQFIAGSTPLKFHSAAWGLLSVFRSLAYFLGPILAGFFLLRGQTIALLFAVLFALVALLILVITRGHHDRPLEVDVHKVNLIQELKYWETLFVHVWPIILLSVFMGLIDATFWTTGAVWSETLAKKNFWGSLFLPSYMLPSLFMGFVVAKWNVFDGKKKMAEKFLLLSGVFLAFLGISDSIFWQLACVFVSSILLSVSYPLTDAVYSDVISRMGKEEKHLIGLSRSTISLAYIVGPIFAGFIASQVGERMTFSVVGIVVVVVAVFLLITTPRKLKLPQEEIKEWE